MEPARVEPQSVFRRTGRNGSGEHPAGRRTTVSSDPLARARTLPSGAVFHRCALQVNPQSYGSRFRGWEPGGDACAHASAVIQKAVEINVSVLAVTDHNDVSGVPAFQDAAKGYGIHVFPGFELSSSDGVHVLCIYPENTDSEQLGRFSASLESDRQNHPPIRRPGISSRSCGKYRNNAVSRSPPMSHTSTACSRCLAATREFGYGVVMICWPFRFPARSTTSLRSTGRSSKTKTRRIAAPTRQTINWPSQSSTRKM